MVHPIFHVQLDVHSSECLEGVYPFLPKAPQALQKKFWKSLPIHLATEHKAALLHRDLTLPYGESLTFEDVENHLEDWLGRTRSQFETLSFHSYSQDDTQQGTLHRLLITLGPKSDPPKPQETQNNAAKISEPQQNLVSTNHQAHEGLYHPGLAVLALAELLHTHVHIPNFHFCLFDQGELYSLVYKLHLPAHLLCLHLGNPEPAETHSSPLASNLPNSHPDPSQKKLQTALYPQLNQRLKKQLRSIISQEGPVPLFTVFTPTARKCSPREEIDPLIYTWGQPDPDCWAIHTTPPEILPRQASQNPLAAGLALAHQHPELSKHNLASPQARYKARNKRESRFFIQSCLFSLLVFVVLFGRGKLILLSTSNQLKKVENQLGPLVRVAQSIETRQKAYSSNKVLLDSLQHVWRGPQNWQANLSLLQNALPPKAQLEGLLVQSEEPGIWKWQFRLLVDKWEDFQVLEKNLNQNNQFKNINMSNQSRDESKNRFSAIITCNTQW